MAREIERPTNGSCKVCGGEIVQRVIKGEFVGRGMPVYGPAGKGQYADVSEGFHCKECGIQYRFVPQIKEQEESKEPSEGKKICPKCGNEIRRCRLAVGGFPGHPHIHPSGPVGYECKCGYKEKGEV